MTISDETGTIKLDSVSIEEMPTAQLRFIERDVPVHLSLRTVRILQQRWVIVTRATPPAISSWCSYEWRDVPLELEE